MRQTLMRQKIFVELYSLAALVSDTFPGCAAKPNQRREGEPAGATLAGHPDDGYSRRQGAHQAGMAGFGCRGWLSSVCNNSHEIASVRHRAHPHLKSLGQKVPECFADLAGLAYRCLQAYAEGRLNM